MGGKTFEVILSPLHLDFVPILLASDFSNRLVGLNEEYVGPSE